VYKCFHLDFDESLVESLPSSSLPTGWRQEPPLLTTQDVGNTWIREARSVVLAVPSVLIPEERNYLLNPAHPDFPKIAIGEATDFTFDPRLLN
jgi:RES domain-containing protein